MNSAVRNLRTLAPAKINWTLEVLGPREDGYHEIRSVMQTIDLCDEVKAEPSEAPIFETVDGERLGDDDLMVQGARALEGHVRRALPVRIRVQKRVPVASGLGGGSSDAAAVLRLLDRLYGLGLAVEEMAEVGAAIGSDVPFFLYGGTALVEGKGERVSSLPDVRETWFVIGVPFMFLVDKTKRMYLSLTADHFTDGSWTQRAVEKLRAGAAVETNERYNVFHVPAYVMYQEPLVKLGDAMLYAGARTFEVAGSGPAISAKVDSRDEAESLVRKIRAFVIGDFHGAEANLMIARTLPAAEATAIVE
ncbi:MAG: 4-(cytidine 5'-diphospho)-2-C-methyl-D-erythritol kinase [Chloroflexi bacterium]|nr:MAG: 4-(cytidine 5'-diphospho)-2-C-methyl-D-erythritol kinase [Chloroflexota bacterium]